MHRQLTKTWDSTFLDMAFLISQRSKDPSTQVGAVLMNAKNVILGSGFNGPPSQIDDTLVPWDERPQKYAYVIHAEENAMHFALASHGDEPLNGATMYCTHAPCTECVLRMIRCNIQECIFPEFNSTYPLQKFQVNPTDVIKCQKTMVYLDSVWHKPKLIKLTTIQGYTPFTDCKAEWILESASRKMKS